MVGLNCLNHGSEAADAFLQPVDVCMPTERFHDAVIDKHRAALLKMGSQCSQVCCLLNLGAAAAMVNSGPDSADCMAKLLSLEIYCWFMLCKLVVVWFGSPFVLLRRRSTGGLQPSSVLCSVALWTHTPSALPPLGCGYEVTASGFVLKWIVDLVSCCGNFMLQ
ncbi:hypothetical protein Nepgr_031330 [Nepenthes gracilis]|uniref:Uncharacterized protein n=1 Tax=Nepenthes gracilis TaxID=150966 RepID=A0AAD3Y4P9_NEPGR|nr:hypothetical protein Nepgr_031330 [Nepenthes gracilis]